MRIVSILVTETISHPLLLVGLLNGHETRQVMRPFYFGPSQKPLFGIHHAPEAGPSRSYGVVLCYPIGDEYVQAHRAFRQLAINLARAGFHALRFDYYGSGDSAGDSDEGDINQWRNDISTAIEELKDISGIPRVSLIGSRLGGSLAALVGFSRIDVSSIVLWEPIVNGKDYINELLASHQKWLVQHDWVKDTLTMRKFPNGNIGNLEILGFPLTDVQRTAIENINLMTTHQCRTKHLLIVESLVKASFCGISNHLTALGVHLDYEHIPGPQFWRKQARPDKTLVPTEALRSIVSWISKDSQ